MRDIQGLLYSIFHISLHLSIALMLSFYVLLGKLDLLRSKEVQSDLDDAWKDERLGYDEGEGVSDLELVEDEDGER